MGAVAQGPGQTHLAIPVKIEALPEQSFVRGRPVTLKATFAKDAVMKLGGLCQGQGFAIRVYDANTVAHDQVVHVTNDSTHSIKVTPYLQQTGVEFDPLTGPDDVRAVKEFPAFKLKAQKRLTPARIYAALFRTCDAIARPVDVDRTAGTILYDNELTGTYIGGTFFNAKCDGSPTKCWYQPE